MVELVLPSPDEEKSGCHWCSLFPWCGEFVECADDFGRDADKIRAREKDGHHVQSHRVEEAYTQVDLLFVGDVPGKQEDMQRVPLAGASGEVLYKGIEVSLPELTRAQIGVTNVVRCRTPRNREVNKTEIKSCSPQLVREIQEREPSVLVALGNVPLAYLTGHTGITTFNGKVLECVVPGLEHIPVVAALHPSYVCRFDHETENFCQALQAAGRVLDGSHVQLAGAGEYRVCETADEVVALMARLRERRVVTYDTETGALSVFQDKFPALLCFSFTDEEGVGYTVPWDHAESKLRGDTVSRTRAAKALCGFFTDPRVRKIAQNEKFDRKHIRRALGVEPVNVCDTMLMHLVLDERRGTHGLKVLAYAYTGMGGYDKPLARYIAENPEANPDKGGSYANVPGDLLFPYGGMDTDVTWRVYHAMLQDPAYADNPRFHPLVESFLPGLSECLADVEYEGAQIDVESVKALHAKYTAKMEDVRRRIGEYTEVRQFVEDREAKGVKDPGLNLDSPKQMQTLLFGYFREKPVKLTKTGLKRLAYRFDKLKKEGESVTNQSVIAGAYAAREFEHFSTDAEVLYDMQRRDVAIATDVLAFRAVATLYKTFINPLRDKLDAQERVHGEFLIHGTVTGRLSSREPNLQNIPNKGGGMVKRVYGTRFGEEGLLVQVDYSQIELRIAASLFNDRGMLKAYRDGLDLHAIVARDIWKTQGKSVEAYDALNKDERKLLRTIAKRINFGILYGGGAHALMSALKKEGVYLTEAECQGFVDDYLRARPDLVRGIERLKKTARRQAYLESFTGRRRRVPEVSSEDESLIARALRQSINFPVQSAAADMTLMAMVLIWREMRVRQLRSRTILTVHDSIVYDCHVDEVFEVMQLAQATMENLPQMSDDVLPGLDWSWLKVPIKADVEVGTTWGTLVGVEDPFNDEPAEVDALWEKMAEAI